MKRTRFIVLALAMAVMLLGAGYAFWTQDLVVEGTVATGELAVEFDNPEVKLLDCAVHYAGADDPVISDHFVNTGDENNQLNIGLTNMYPGAKANVSFNLVNTGTMAAKVTGFSVSDFDEKAYVQVENAAIGEMELGDFDNLDEFIAALNEKGICLGVNNEEGTMSLMGCGHGPGHGNCDPNEPTEPNEPGNDNDCSLDCPGMVTVSFDLVIAPCADESQVAENSDFEFTINANVKQFNDDGSCEEN